MLSAALNVVMGFFKNSFTKGFEWVLEFVDKKVVYQAAMLAAVSAALVVFYTAIDAILGGLIGSFPSGSMFQGFLYMIIPPNLPACFTAVATAWGAIKVYQWTLLSMEMYK